MPVFRTKYGSPGIPAEPVDRLHHLAGILRYFTAALIVFLLCPVAGAQLEFEEKERHFDTTFFDFFGRQVDIGPNVVVVVKSGNGVPWTNDEPPHKILLFEQDTTFIRSLSIPGQVGGTPIISANGDADEILVGTGFQPLLLLQKDQGGLEKWGQVATIGTYGGGALIALDGDTVVAGAQYPTEGFDIFERDQGGVGNWGLVTNASHINDNDISDIDFDGDLLVAGEPEFNSNAGRAYIYQRDVGGTDAWGLVATLNNPDVSPPVGVRFGGVVAISGDTVTIGMTRAGESEFLEPGAAWVFQQDAGSTDNWGFVKRIEPDTSVSLGIPNGRSHFGASLDIDGDNLIVGAYGSQVHGIDTKIQNGRYFHFNRDQGGTDNWGQTGFYAANSDPTARRGKSVAIHGGKFVASLPSNDRLEFQGDPSEDIYDSGSVDIGNVPNGFGVQVFPSAFVDRRLGRQIAASKDDLAIAGSTLDGNNMVLIKQQTYRGSTNNLGVLSLTQGFKSTQRLVPPLVLNQFGHALAMNDDGWLAVGDRSRQSGGGATEEGIVILYEKNFLAGEPWIKRKTLRGVNPYSFTIGWFGESLAMNDELLVVGAPYFPNNVTDMIQTGRAFVYAKNQGGTDNWGLMTDLTAGDGQALDLFGREVSLSRDGNTIAVATTGTSRGAIYLFERDHGDPDNWSQIQKVTPDVTTAGFGVSLQVDGDTLVVGTDDEKVFVFERNAGGENNWGQVQALTDPINSGATDGFGKLVALQNDLISITADSAATLSNGTGKVMVFRRDPVDHHTRNHAATLFAGDAAPNGYLGDALFMKGDHIYVGARFATKEDAFQGKVYHFVVPPRVNSVAAFDGSDLTELAAGNGPAEASKGVNQFEVRFSQNVATFDFAAPYPRPPEDVIMPGNYLLYHAGSDGELSTTDCAGGVQGDDQEIVVNSVVWNPDAFIATLEINGGEGLRMGDYRLHVCGSTSIINYWEEKLDGNADLAGGEDYTLDFTVAADDLMCFPIKGRQGDTVVICI